ncbi:exosortase A [Acidovorax sp. SRB_14]|uniref:exosortase A n=1 Tax=Acidovorax sp. SRB_14 TaxID=1962699 RepID=UPI0015656DB0|nr:exosortase A [Acidovorax sp. SRB_14]NMM81206.1 exosortase A [Acidovorax sp. SRB_14]
MPLIRRIPEPWRQPLLALCLLQMAILLLFWRTALGMVTIWSTSDTYAHGYVVPLITLWLLWRIRDRWVIKTPQSSRWAGVLMTIVAVFWLLGDLVVVNATTHLALVALLVLSVPVILGWDIARIMIFPLAFLFFAVPIGDFMLPQLMEWTADFTVVALRWTGIPVYREGLQFIIPSGSWSVVEACSGIRYLIASITVGCIFAYLTYTSLRKRLIFVGISILVPLVANWLRAYMIVMIGHFSGNELATGVDHLIYGWVFFGIVIFFMLLIGSHWEDQLTAGEKSAVESSTTSVHERPAIPSRDVWVAFAVALTVVAFPHLAKVALLQSVSSNPVVLSAVQAQPPWHGADTAPAFWTPNFQNPSASSHTGYIGPDGQRVGLHLTYFRQQNNKRKLVTSSNVLVDSDDMRWSRVSSGTSDVSFGGVPTRVATAVLREQGGGLARTTDRILTWRFYWVNNRFMSSDVMAKLHTALGLLAGRGDDGAIIVLYTVLPTIAPTAEAEAQGNHILQAFLSVHGSALRTTLGMVREGH